MNCRFYLVLLGAIFVFTGSLQAGEAVFEAPRISLNGKPSEVTAQDLSGLLTRPLRLLVNRNNKVHGEGFFRVYASGVCDGDDLVATIAVHSPGVRASIYRIFRDKSEGLRYLSMPASTYFAVPKTEEFREKVESVGEEYLIFVFEKTDAADEKNIQIRYFEERVRKLVIASFKTNLTLSSLKLRMKDFGGDETADFFERDAQFLIDRMSRPQQILLLRLWKREQPRIVRH